MFKGLIRKFMCRHVMCMRCKVHNTDEGIGGKCVDCGRIHGWLTRDELRYYGRLHEVSIGIREDAQGMTADEKHYFKMGKSIAESLGEANVK